MCGWGDTKHEKQIYYRKMNKKSLSFALYILSVLCLLPLVAVVLLLVLPPFFGIRPFTVISGSMQATIPVGSVVYVRDCEPAQLEEGEIVTFYMNYSSPTPTTHRVLENHVEEKELITKGDSNSSEDIVPIPYHLVIGKVILSLPVLGWVSLALSTLQGKTALVILFLLGFLLKELSERI